MLTALALILANAQAAEPPTIDAATAEGHPIPSIEEAHFRIADIDTAMFYAAFEGCEPAKVREHITEDFRMVHDLGGIVADSGDGFAAMLEEGCKQREPGGPQERYKNRRLLVPGSDTVTPLGEWGVLHRGWHTFHEWRDKEQRWEIVGGGRFLNLYQWMPEEGRFRMQETLSLDHGAAKSHRPEDRRPGG
ncbi:MAG: DUF4440 domain-containing protein [Pseudomonadota bacterium]